MNHKRFACQCGWSNCAGSVLFRERAIGRIEIETVHPTSRKNAKNQLIIVSKAELLDFLKGGSRD